MACRFATAALLMALFGVSGAKERKNMIWWGETETRCVGRFCLLVPKSMTGRGIYAMRGISLAEVAWPYPREGAFQRAWQQKVEEIALRSRQRQSGEATGTVLESATFKRDVLQGIYYNPKESATSGAWTVLLDAGLGGLWLNRTYPIEYRLEIKSSIAELAAAYKLRKPGVISLQSGADFFYLDDGLIKLPYEQVKDGEGQEVVDLTLHGLDVRFEIQTQTVAEPEKKTLLEGLHQLLAVAVEGGFGGLLPAKYGSRTVAGLKGEELIMRDSSEHKMYFRWMFPGQRYSGRQPKIELDLQVKTEGESEKKGRQLWDALLDSMRPAAEAR